MEFDLNGSESEEDEEQKDSYLEAVRERVDTFVGTYNYLSPEVIKREPHTVAIDTWALGLIYFKMRIGKPAFPGKSEIELEAKIQQRQIKWPSEYKTDKHANFDEDEKDLVDKLCQLEPKNRLGGSKESMPALKAHKAFKDIDWVAISKPDFVGAVSLVNDLVMAENDYHI